MIPLQLNSQKFTICRYATLETIIDYKDKHNTLYEFAYQQNFFMHSCAQRAVEWLINN